MSNGISIDCNDDGTLQEARLKTQTLNSPEENSLYPRKIIFMGTFFARVNSITNVTDDPKG